MVRALASARQVRGDLKLCNVPQLVRNVLEMTRLSNVFDLHESEKPLSMPSIVPPIAPQHLSPQAAAFCALTPISTCSPTCANCCAAWIRGPNHDRMSDATLLLRVSHFDLLLVGPTSYRRRPRRKPSRMPAPNCRDRIRQRVSTVMRRGWSRLLAVIDSRLSQKAS